MLSVKLNIEPIDREFFFVKYGSYFIGNIYFLGDKNDNFLLFTVGGQNRWRHTINQVF